MAKRILIIEDNKDLANLLAMHLRDLSHEIDLAGDGVAGLDFGNSASLGAIHGYVFDDLEGDKLDNSDSRVSGLSVELHVVGGTQPVAVTVTDENGEFEFRDLPSP